jgi:hypothetical protein
MKNRPTCMKSAGWAFHIITHTKYIFDMFSQEGIRNSE